MEFFRLPKEWKVRVRSVSDKIMSKTTFWFLLANVKAIAALFTSSVSGNGLIARLKSKSLELWKLTILISLNAKSANSPSQEWWWEISSSSKWSQLKGQTVHTWYYKESMSVKNQKKSDACMLYPLLKAPQ